MRGCVWRPKHAPKNYQVAQLVEEVFCTEGDCDIRF